MDALTSSSECMPGALDRAAALLRVMGNVDRLQLLAALQREELCVGQLAQRLDIQQPTLSQQLTVQWASKKMLSPRTITQGEPSKKSAPTRKASAKPHGRSCTA